jgi:hypothetical protein
MRVEPVTAHFESWTEREGVECGEGGCVVRAVVGKKMNFNRIA